MEISIADVMSIVTVVLLGGLYYSMRSRTPKVTAPVARDRVVLAHEHVMEERSREATNTEVVVIYRCRLPGCRATSRQALPSKEA